jgi:dihydrodipicolinate synthase/N-acetylneuraminate lyase
MNWRGVIPAITTCFDGELRVDHGFMADHCRWLVSNGCSGIVALGSLGEGGTLSFEEKTAILATCVRAMADRAPVMAGISSLSTTESVRIARAAADAGCSALMVLPPFVYRGDWRETRTHVGAIFKATRLPCMLYNNPISYGTDFTPGQIAELASEYENFEAVKESSADVRRVTAIRALLDARLAVFVGVDDAIVEGIAAGAVGWIAGLANALPAESVELFELALKRGGGSGDEAFALYRWFLPLLQLDTVPKFVQLIKLVQQAVGRGNTRVRPPRLELEGDELADAQAVITAALSRRPAATAR